MKITELEIHQITVPLRKSFVISSSASYEYEGVLVKIHTDNTDIYGLGEAAPSHRITNETQATVINNLARLKPVLIDKNPLEIELIMNEIDSRFSGSSAKAAVDIALHDIMGKYLALPLNRLFGNDKTEIRTSVTVSIRDIEQTVKEAYKLVEQKVKNIKLKIGTKIEDDIAKVKAVREAIGYEPRLRLDANEGYSVKQAIEVLRGLERYEIEFIEQPIQRDDISGLREIRNITSIPVMADESMSSAKDALEIIRNDAADMFNIKLMKCGGIRNALKILNIAESSGIPCMLGCMLETKVGITAGTHLALGKKIVRYADLDGHLDLNIDCVNGGVQTENGINRLTAGAGLGVELDKKIISSLSGKN